MFGSRKNILSEVNPDPERQIFIHKCLLDIKQRKSNQQTTIPENLDNKEDPKRDIHGST